MDLAQSKPIRAHSLHGIMEVEQESKICHKQLILKKV